MLKLYSNESINFQTNGSPFANELIAIFQEVIDKRESIPLVTERVKIIPKYCKDIMSKKLINAIKKYTGITCTKINFSKSIDMGLTCLMNFGDKWGLLAEDVIARYSGIPLDPMITQYMDELHLSPKSAKDMESVVQSLNRETGKFSLDKLSSKSQYTMTIYFDPYGMFLIKECAHIKLDYFTAEEITGIVLHEIGHMISTLAHSADICFRIQVYNRCMDYFLKNADNSEKSKVLKSSIAKLDPKLKAKSDKAIDQCTAVDKHNIPGNFFENIYGWICDTVITGLSMILLLPILNSILEGLYVISQETAPELYTNSFDLKKSSDYFYMKKQVKVCEQFADEYATKHGMSHGLVSGLNKLAEYSEFAFSYGSYFGSRISTIAYHINKVSVIVNILLWGDPTDIDMYDRKPDRAQHALDELLKVFKNKLSPEMADYFLEDYIKTKNALTNKTLCDRIMNFAYWSRKAINYLISALPAMLVSGRITTEYEKLYKDGEKLRSNSLFMRATKLDQLYRR